MTWSHGHATISETEDFHIDNEGIKETVLARVNEAWTESMTLLRNSGSQDSPNSSPNTSQSETLIIIMYHPHNKAKIFLQIWI